MTNHEEEMQEKTRSDRSLRDGFNSSCASLDCSALALS